MSMFRDKVAEIEVKTKAFIDHAFQRLRSAEGAFDLLEKFQHIQSRQSIKDQMMEKFDDIIGQASKELVRVPSGLLLCRYSRSQSPAHSGTC